jgi:CelD/BcsL family acetyltransferase involved in cellulose biosynthesis
MASFGWNLAAATAFANEQTAMLLMAHDADGIIRAVAPLARASRFGCRWEMLGVRRLNEPADFIYTDREALLALIESLVRLRQPLLLNRIPADSPTIAMLQDAAHGRAIVAIRPQASCPFIPLDESWSVPESHFSSRRRSDYRRALRRAERHGDVRAEVISPTPANLDSLLQTAYEIEARSWKGAAGTALACDPLRGGHLRQFAAWAAKSGTLRIALLWIGRQPVAMQIATEESGRWWLLKIGFDPAWSDCSPGNLLLAETVRHAVRQQLITYEFLGTAESWTHVWTARERQCVSVRVYPFGLRGAAVLAADALRIAGQRACNRFRALLNRRGAGEEHPAEQPASAAQPLTPSPSPASGAGNSLTPSN